MSPQWAPTTSRLDSHFFLSPRYGARTGRKEKVTFLNCRVLSWRRSGSFLVVNTLEELSRCAAPLVLPLAGSLGHEDPVRRGPGRRSAAWVQSPHSRLPSTPPASGSMALPPASASLACRCPERQLSGGPPARVHPNPDNSFMDNWQQDFWKSSI